MELVKSTLLGIARALASAHAAAPSPELDAAHKQMRAALYRLGSRLGLTRSDIAEIDNVGVIEMGGTPKDPPPEEGGG